MTDARFFIDHGMIHDRLTGKHVTTDEDSVFCDGINACCELLNDLASNLAAQQTRQPIETAPKDGTEIVCFYTICGSPWAYVAIWNGIQWYSGFGDSWPRPKPTHWAPLPALQSTGGEK